MKEGKILCIVEGYCGLTEANAICLSNISKYWKEKGLSVDYVSIEKEGTKPNRGIIPCYIPEKKTDKIIFNKIRKLLNIPIGRPFLVNKLTDIIRCAIKNNHYSCILCVVNPIESVEAIKKIKKEFPSMTVVLYEIDPSSNRYKKVHNLIELYWKYKSIRWEIDSYSKIDRIIHMKTHKNHFDSKVYTPFLDKTVYLDIPTFIPRNPVTKEHNGYDIVRMLYTGAFYPKLRNPRKMISLLKKLANSISIEVKIYTNNKMFDSVDEMVNNCPSISLNHYIGQDSLREEINNCDILLDIGNKESDYLPSKTIQYMSEGKPIIHFSPDEYDVTIEYLEKHPLCLIVDEQEAEDYNILRIIEFISYIKIKRCFNPNVLNEVLKLNTPEYSGKIIMEQFKK